MNKKILANARFAFRADALIRWQTLNPVLAKGEPSVVDGLNEVGDGLYDETERVKFGDGIHSWIDLPWWKGPKGEKGETGEQGDKGEDYILTDADKQEIAGMVDVPEVDQTYNPESENAQSGKAVNEALTDYVKSTDAATATVAGVVKVSNGTFGVNIGESGTISIDDASESQIDAKADAYKPITPRHLDYAVKSATDQSYNAESEMPQSGIAVAQALRDYYTAEEVNEKIEALNPKLITFTDGSTLTIEDNAEYIAETDITNLTIVYPERPFICSLYFTLASEGDITITLTESKYIGGIPSFGNGETWELNIKNGVVVGGLIE